MKLEVIYDHKVVKYGKNKKFPNAVKPIKYIDKNWNINDASFNIIHPHPKLGIGTIIPPKTDRCCIRHDCTVDLTGNIILSPDVLIQENTQIFTHTHSWSSSKKARKKIMKTWIRDLVIEDDVFIGAAVLIIGVKRIGKGAIIGAGAVITKDVGPYEVWVGNPAKKIKVRGI